MKNKLTKYGLTGDSGLNVAGTKLFHIATNYYAGEGKVFIEKEHKEWGLIWQRMTIKRALKEKRKIITCSKCDKPAISLDHHWPYYSDNNYCIDHKKT